MGKLFIISACSGAGKTTLVNRALKSLQKDYPIERLITYTTKNPRNNEIPGKDYHYLPIDEFKQKIEEGFFLEWSGEYGNLYGTPASLLTDLSQGRSYFVITDLKGAYTYFHKIPQATFIWIETKSLETLKQRLFLRKTEQEDEINKRFLLAKQEILKKNEKNIFQYTIVNDNLENAVLELICIASSAMKNL